jgi:hypothetical protein
VAHELACGAERSHHPIDEQCVVPAGRGPVPRDVSAEEPGLACRAGDAVVGLAVRIGDGLDRASGGRLELATPLAHRPRQLAVVEERQDRVAAGVEADLEPGGSESADVSRTEPRVGRVGTRVLEQGLLDTGASGIRQRGDRAAERPESRIRLDRGVDVGRNAARNGLGRSHAAIERTLEPLPPERARRGERGPAQEEGRGKPERPEQRRGHVHVAPHVVVEGQSDREPSTAASGSNGLREVRGCDDVEPRTDRPEVLLEPCRPERGRNGSVRVARRIVDAVVQEDDAHDRRAAPPRLQAGGHRVPAAHDPAVEELASRCPRRSRRAAPR